VKRFSTVMDLLLVVKGLHLITFGMELI
jgi:hypothetical protein